MPRLDGKTALVTGSSSGIGLAIAQRFAVEGAYVYLTGRRQSQLEHATESIGPNAIGIRSDMSKLADLDRLYAQIADDNRRLDVVVANAGGLASAANGGSARLEDFTEQHYEQVLNNNLRATVFTVKKALPLLNDSASVILIGAIAADMGNIGYGMYAAAKAAVRSLSRTWANELKGRGIRVNTIAPGTINTPALAQMAPDPAQTDELYSALAANVPLGRVAEPAEIASVALFLASSDSSYITGSNLDVDGGMAQV